jgi:hypothetical protein
MPYTPNPYNSLQPEDSVFAGTAAAEFRAMKVALQALSTGSLYRGDWSSFVSPAPAALGDQFTHAGSLWLLKVATTDVTLIAPDVLDTVNWFKLYESTTTGLVAKTSSTGEALMPGGTTAERGVAPVIGSTRFNTTLGCNETWNGTDWIQEGSSRGGVIALAGAATLLTGIPPWANWFTVHMLGASLNGVANWNVRVGTSAAIQNTQYQASSVYDNLAGATAGSGSLTSVPLRANSAAVVLYGDVTFRRADARWTVSGILSDRNLGLVHVGGQVDVIGILDRVEISPTAGLPDAGAASLSWGQ